MAAAAKEAVTETWLYAGQRYSAGKLFHAWYDANGEEIHFAKVKGSMPGHAYAVEAVRDGGALAVRGNPRYLAEQADRQATPAQLDTWRAEDKAAKARVEGERIEKAAPKDDELERALEVIRRHRAKLRSYVKRGAFDTYVLGEIGRAPRDEREEL